MRGPGPFVTGKADAKFREDYRHNRRFLIILASFSKELLTLRGRLVILTVDKHIFSHILTELRTSGFHRRFLRRNYESCSRIERRSPISRQETNAVGSSNSRGTLGRAGTIATACGLATSSRMYRTSAVGGAPIRPCCCQESREDAVSSSRSPLIAFFWVAPILFIVGSFPMLCCTASLCPRKRDRVLP